ncbi:MAG: 7-cyano-7-deazaguanine synthase QueC [Bacteroidia bacterium]|nr:7-cyano-7-deazaguanine synthase QueC [Bacteroidia bacterium]
MEDPRAILLLSGGIDSTTLLAQLTREGREVHALSFHYGQRHEIELELAARNAARYQVRAHHLIHLDNSLFRQKSSLTNPALETSTYPGTDLPLGVVAEVVPARNLIFLAQAVSYAETLGCTDIYAAFNRDDSQNFPDCRPAFIRALNRSLRAQSSQPRPPQVLTPLIALRKAGVVALAMQMQVDLSQTLSCYQPRGYEPCGRCLSCRVREQALKTWKNP